jgi:GNAT superfamily N-acetyltransferase
MDPALAFDDPAGVAAILGADLPPGGIPVFASGVIASLPAQRSAVSVCLNDGCWVVQVEGKPIAWAWSARSNAESAELAVEVDPEHQRRGYGRQVAAAWAWQVIAAGQVAFYSFRTTNLPSQVLARSLGVQVFARCTAFD